MSGGTGLTGGTGKGCNRVRIWMPMKTFVHVCSVCLIWCLLVVLLEIHRVLTAEELLVWMQYHHQGHVLCVPLAIVAFAYIHTYVAFYRNATLPPIRLHLITSVYYHGCRAHVCPCRHGAPWVHGTLRCGWVRVDTEFGRVRVIIIVAPYGALAFESVVYTRIVQCTVQYPYTV